VNEKRDSLSRDLVETRDAAKARMAQAVTALESIRLDLLRLQMGSTGIESVTASLAAAQRVGEQIALAVESQAEVERMLRATPVPKAPRVEDEVETNEDADIDDDADTPVSGVPATRG
jgi:hypothetical protein